MRTNLSYVYVVYDSWDIYIRPWLSRLFNTGRQLINYHIGRSGYRENKCCRIVDPGFFFFLFHRSSTANAMFSTRAFLPVILSQFSTEVRTMEVPVYYCLRKHLVSSGEGMIVAKEKKQKERRRRRVQRNQGWGAANFALATSLYPLSHFY